ncbi:MAG: phosphoribosyl-ATP diphosphatase [Candidatus Peribacteraceae bacterium]|nr:phosphoribosyl-ATP diphosphatase [Candidatus Peribacteraceae bacterium]
MEQSSTSVVLLPKTAFGNGSRTPISDLFRRAGYDKVAGDFGRGDQVEQGDFLFRAVKGQEALAAQMELFRGKSIGIIMGTDVLGEADLLARERGVSPELERLLTLGIGPCSLRILAPQEAPVGNKEDLTGRSIFTKYPKVLGELLRTWGVSASVRPTLGADVRVNEFREGSARVAALEIVGSGETARRAKLQVVSDELSYPQIGITDCAQIQTDIFLTNRSRISGRTRDAFQELGLALESARDQNQYAAFRFNIPEALLPAFASCGMKGPTVANVDRDGSRWKALEIVVPKDQENAVRVNLLRDGAQDLVRIAPVNVEISAENSEVLSVLPFSDTAQPAEPEEAAVIGATLDALAATIKQRAEAADAGNSTTRKLLDGGTLMQGARLIEEATEVARAARKEGRGRVIEETADLLYMLLVLLQGQQVTLAEVSEALRRRRR